MWATAPVAATSLFTASDADADSIVQYDFWDSGQAGGHWLLNGVALPNNQENFVSAAQLSQVTYRGGGGTETICERASDGIQFGAWVSVNATGTGPRPWSRLRVPTSTWATSVCGHVLVHDKRRGYGDPSSSTTSGTAARPAGTGCSTATLCPTTRRISSAPRSSHRSPTGAAAAPRRSTSAPATASSSAPGCRSTRPGPRPRPW